VLGLESLEGRLLFSFTTAASCAAAHPAGPVAWADAAVSTAPEALPASQGSDWAVRAAAGGGEGEAGEVTVVIGDHELQPDQPAQEISIFVSGGLSVQAVEFNLQVADGGAALGGQVAGPAIAGIDISSGTVFGGNNLGTDDADGLHPDRYAQIEWRSTATESGSVIADGLLATVQIDTSGFFAGTWSLVARDTINGPTRFPFTPTAVIDGTITIVGRENLPPVAIDDRVVTERAVAVTIDVVADNGNGSDHDDGQVVGPPTVVVAPQHGSANVDLQSGLIVYAPQPGYTGLDTFTYTTVDDQGAISNPATVTVEIVKPPTKRELLAAAAASVQTAAESETVSEAVNGEGLLSATDSPSTDSGSAGLVPNAAHPAHDHGWYQRALRQEAGARSERSVRVVPDDRRAHVADAWQTAHEDLWQILSDGRIRSTGPASVDDFFAGWTDAPGISS
jgi:hypothetical protein